jgi:DNA-binding MarR family transcriptional regulator
MEILRGIERIGQLTNRFLTARLADLSITELEMHILLHLSDRHRAPIADVQRAFGLRPSTLTHGLDRLEGRGYLTRQFNPDDRRSLVVVLTPEGEVMAAAVVELLHEVENDLRSRLSDQDLAGFRALVRAVVDVTS